MTTLSRKADIALADLAAGGKLTVEQSNQFIRNVIDQPTIIQSSRTIIMNSESREINKIGFGSRMMKAASQVQGSRALAVGDRTQPDLGKVTLQSKETIAEIRLPYEVLEDNIEKGDMQNTILALIAERASLDLEELCIQGDTASGDTFLALQDGYLKLASSNVVDGLDAGITPDIFNSIVKALPTRYRRNKAAMRHYIPMDIEQDYRTDQAKRGTGLGDATLTGNTAIRLFGTPAKGVAMLPSTAGLFCHPQNLLFGIQRNVSLETDKDISAREVIIVLTARVAVGIEEETAVVKMTGLGTVT